MTLVMLSPERVGRITASRVSSVLCITGAYQSRKAVMREMVRAAFDDPPLAEKDRARMDYGQDNEAAALAAYETDQGVLTHSQQRFFIHPDYDWLGCTVDALVGDDGLVECKAPSEQGRYYYVEDKPIFDAQIRLQIECTQRDWGDLAVWRDGQQIAVSRVHHDPLWLPGVLPKLQRFHDDYLATVADADRALVVRLGADGAVPELIRQRDQARRIACELEAENASLQDTLRDRELAS